MVGKKEIDKKREEQKEGETEKKKKDRKKNLSVKRIYICWSVSMVTVKKYWLDNDTSL